MTGYYVLAAVDGNRIYAMHEKVYLSEDQAKNALNNMKKKKKRCTYEVFGITDLKEIMH